MFSITTESVDAFVRMQIQTTDGNRLKRILCISALTNFRLLIFPISEKILV